MPPECDGRCWEEDVKHPLSSCDLEVVAGAITPAEADEVVAAAEAHAATHGWHSQRHIAYPTMDLPWTALPAVARIFDKLWGAMEASVRARCGIRPLDRLTPNDVFVVKYTPEGQAGPVASASTPRSPTRSPTAGAARASGWTHASMPR